MQLEKIIKQAAADRERHFKLGKPMLAKEGFKEANIAHDISYAFRRAGYYSFPEFTLSQGGAVDHVFVRRNEVIVCEWKRLYARHTQQVADQTKRIKQFKPKQQFAEHGFPSRPWKVKHLWVCDAWTNNESVKWWLGQPTEISTRYPFHDWDVGKYSFPSLGENYDHYCWLWAIH